MKPCCIFVEGTADKAFVNAALGCLGIGTIADVQIQICGGWTKLARPTVKRQLDNGNVVVIIFDADDDQKDGEHGGHARRLSAICETLGEELFRDVHVFLFPDNQSDGDLERLLEKMVRVEHRSVIGECWSGYEQCLARKQKYNLPSSKSKMHEYAAAIDPDVWKDQGFNKTFAKDAVWDWSSSALEPLKSFLKKKLGDA